MIKDIPEIALQRLPVYLNYLKTLPNKERSSISSGAIANALGLGEVLVRKDLAYTSAVGKPRVGYNTLELISAIEEFLGCNHTKNAVIVGVGGLGRAILSYGGFSKYGIEITAAFDNDEKKAGTEISGKKIHSPKDMSGVIAQTHATLAVLCVPASAAQAIADELIKCGICGILNFAPLQINAPEGVTVRNIDVAANLAILSSIVMN